VTDFHPSVLPNDSNEPPTEEAPAPPLELEAVWHRVIAGLADGALSPGW
jgi:uncharacterized RDD family membrane protein YckC